MRNFKESVFLKTIDMLSQQPLLFLTLIKMLRSFTKEDALRGYGMAITVFLVNKGLTLQIPIINAAHVPPTAKFVHLWIHAKYAGRVSMFVQETMPAKKCVEMGRNFKMGVMMVTEEMEMAVLPYARYKWVSSAGEGQPMALTPARKSAIK